MQNQMKLALLVALALAASALLWLALRPAVPGESYLAPDGKAVSQVEVGSQAPAPRPGGQGDLSVDRPGSPDRMEAASDADTNGAGRIEGPDHGPYRSRAALLEEAERSIRTWALDPEKWISMQLRWQVSGVHQSFEGVPFDLLAGGAVDEAVRREAERVASSFTDSIRLQAEYALRLLDESAVDYAHSRLERVPRGTKVPMRSMEGGSLEYVVFTRIPAGDWDYVIDFHSVDYERFQQALDQLAALKEQRRQEVLRVLGADH